MSIKFNPFSCELDIAGSDGAVVTVAPRYTQTITNPGSWTVDGADYSITIPVATHGKDTTSSVVCFEEVSAGQFEQVYPNITINTAGDVKVKVSGTPDLRFSGKLIII